MLPLPEAPWNPAQDHLSGASEVLLISQAERKRRGPSLTTTGPHRKKSLMCVLSPRSALGAKESALLVPHRPTLAPGHPTAVIADKIKHIYFQKESKYPPLPNISILHLMQLVFRAISTPCHAGQGLVGHLRCVRVGNGYDKMRLHTPICSKTTAFLRCAGHRSAQQGHSGHSNRGD